MGSHPKRSRERLRAAVEVSLEPWPPPFADSRRLPMFRASGLLGCGAHALDSAISDLIPNAHAWPHRGDDIRTRLAVPGVLSLLLLLSGPAAAQGLLDRVTSHLANNWEQATRATVAGDWTLYATGYAWHAPWRYSSRDRNNDAAWGGGFGRHVYDAAGNYHGLYGLAFLDSSREPMYMAGYNWQTYWGQGDLKLGLGYTLFLFGRTDYMDYVPLPGILPVLSVRYSRFELLGAYVPSLPSIGLDRGDVALFLGRVNF